MKRVWIIGLCGLGMWGNLAQGQTAPVAKEASSARVWTSSDGRTIQATFREVKNDAVVVDVVGGASGVEIKLDRLSEKDREFVKQQEGKAAPAAPAALGANVVKTGILAGYDPALSNFSEPWPSRTGDAVEPEIKVISEDEAGKKFLYESKHFRFETDFAMRPSLLSKIAKNFEACYDLHKALPLNNRRTRAVLSEKFKAKIFQEKDDYMKSGGMPNSNGVYIGGGPDHFMTYAEALGLRKSGSAFAFDMRNSDFHVVYHEIVHLLWADIHDCAGIWMTEGMAELFACAGYSNGVFDFSKTNSLALEYGLEYGKRGQHGRGLGKEITMPRLEKFMKMEQEAFLSGDANKNYGLGLLLTYYFVLLDKEGDGKGFKDCIKALQSNEDSEAARKVLLGGRTYEQLEKDFASGMRRKGVKIEFQ